MGVTLTIKAGKDAGHQQSFSKDVVSIGRTSDNDLVLIEQGVSRKHARIVLESGCYFIEDLGSSNGVVLDGKKIERAELKTGMTIGLGPSVLLAEVDAPSEIEESSRQRRGRRNSNSLAPVQRGRDSGESLERPKHSRRGEESLDSTDSIKERRTAGARRRKSLADSRAVDRESEDNQGLSIAEKARILRENKGMAGQIKLFMAQRTEGQRKAIMFGLGLMALIVICGGLYVVMNQSGDDAFSGGSLDTSEKHFMLSDSPSEKVFGFGGDIGVTQQTRYELHFDFEVSETINAVYYLSFNSRGVESSDEVTISLNSVPIGSVSGGLGDYVKNQKMKLPKKHLQKGDVNELFFDQTKNSRSEGNKQWAISGARIQMIPLPACDVLSGECTREAHQHLEVAEKMWASKAMASENAYNALKNLNTAMLFLEAVDQKPDFYRQVQQMIRDVERYLDQICSKTLLQVKRDEEMRNWTKVVQELKNGLLWYPGPDHSCHDKLKEMLAEYE